MSKSETAITEAAAAAAAVASSDLQIILPFADFNDDLEMRLGRANGNIFHRIPGLSLIHI